MYYLLLTEMQLPRMARRGAACLVSVIGRARKARIEKFEFEQLEFMNFDQARRVGLWALKLLTANPPTY